MYKVQAKPDKEFTTESGAVQNPLATLADEYGGRAQIAEDDHCLVLYLINGDRYKRTAWWFREAVEAMRSLAW